MAGASSSAHGIFLLPNCSHAWYIPATVPGTLVIPGRSAGSPGRFESDASSGTRVMNSIRCGSDMPRWYTSICPYPPGPLASGSATASANETATAASTTLPPSRRISSPAAVATGLALDTAARPVASLRSGGRASSISCRTPRRSSSVPAAMARSRKWARNASHCARRAAAEAPE